jgi:hypothetical protein
MMMIDKLAEKRQDLLLRLENLIVDEPKSARRLAIEMGLHEHTLNSFMRNNRETSMLTLARIEKYILGKEKGDRDE